MTIFEKLEELLKLIKEDDNPLNEWQTNFILDNYKRYEEYGEDTIFSEKQEEKIEDIYDEYF